MEKKVKVLVVEDVEIAQKMAKLILSALNCLVDIAGDGQSALDLVSCNEYDLIFMDLGLPDKDGMEVTRSIREQEMLNQHVPIIALTANYDDAHKSICLNAGMDEFMLKPLTKENSQAMIDKFVKNVINNNNKDEDMKKVSMQIDEKKKQIRCNGFSISYDNLDSATQTITEVFGEAPYQFKSVTTAPFIIDAGSNIGVATLFFKALYPKANILCFEPASYAFKLLERNMQDNNIENVILENVALSQEEGDIDFFGQLFMDSPDARGNSIIKEWGLQRTISNTAKVKSVQLSSYIDRPVDFLKLDIEGAEQQVLAELEKKNKLSLIKEIALEVHQADQIMSINDIAVIVQLLERNQFEVEVVEKDLGSLLPEQIKEWAQKINPRLFGVKAVQL